MDVLFVSSKDHPLVQPRQRLPSPSPRGRQLDFKAAVSVRQRRRGLHPVPTILVAKRTHDTIGNRVFEPKRTSLSYDAITHIQPGVKAQLQGAEVSTLDLDQSEVVRRALRYQTLYCRERTIAELDGSRANKREQTAPEQKSPQTCSAVR